MVEYSTEVEGFEISKFKCVTCVYRGSPLNRPPCNQCVFYKDYPKYKEDVRITTSKLEEYTVSKYPEYVGDSE